jgi:hypothetical protein
MKKHLLGAAIIGAMLAQAPAASAQFGGLHMPGQASGPSAGGDIDHFLVTTAAARELTRISAVALLEAVSDHDTAARIDAEQKAAEATTDPKEREAALQRVSDDANAQLASIDYDTKAKELEASATDDERRRMAIAVFNLALGILQDKDAVVEAHAIVDSANRNPMGMAMQGPKLLRVKDAASNITSEMGNLGKIAGGLPKLMSVAKLQALPASSSDQPMATTL